MEKYCMHFYVFPVQKASQVDGTAEALGGQLVIDEDGYSDISLSLPSNHSYNG